MPVTAPSRGGGPVQKSPRRRDVLAQLQLLVPQQHLSRLHTLPKTKASSTAKRPPPLTLKLSREAQTGTTNTDNSYKSNSLQLTIRQTPYSNRDCPIIAAVTRQNRPVKLWMTTHVEVWRVVVFFFKPFQNQKQKSKHVSNGLNQCLSALI